MDCSIDGATDDDNIPIRGSCYKKIKHEYLFQTPTQKKITITYLFVTFSGLFKAEMSEDQDDVCNVYLSDHYVKNNKDFGNIGLDYETSKSFTVNYYHYHYSTENNVFIQNRSVIHSIRLIFFYFRCQLDLELFQLL